MSKRIIIATLLALAVGSNAVLAADESNSAQAGAIEQVTTLYKDNSAITTYEQLNP